MSKDKKQKKPKTVYIDDGRTIADMSALGGKPKAQSRGSFSKKSPWTTYKEAVRMMFIPMLVTIGIICLAFLIMYLMLI
ncbi:MAG: hypothetical protein IKA64_05730 [Clostridia bacterium]|nr:hypothetical protein [Clostridia bacterium]